MVTTMEESDSPVSGSDEAPCESLRDPMYVQPYNTIEPGASLDVSHLYPSESVQYI